jgi:hypothetical protein
MKLNAHELAVLEQALREAINNGYDYRSAVAYRELLSKLQSLPLGSETFAIETQPSGLAGHAADDGDLL